MIAPRQERSHEQPRPRALDEPPADYRALPAVRHEQRTFDARAAAAIDPGGKRIEAELDQALPPVGPYRVGIEVAGQLVAHAVDDDLIVAGVDKDIPVDGR